MRQKVPKVGVSDKFWQKVQKNSHAIPQFLKEVNLIGLVEKYCVAIAKFCLPALMGKPGNGGVKRQDF